jgi:uncharacterized iron-regulated protein
MRHLSIVVLVLSGCAHPSKVATAPAAPTAPSSGAAEQSEEKPEHGSRGAEEPIPLPHHVLDASGVRLSDAKIEETLKRAHAIYVGEQHSSPHDHAAQIEVLEAAFAADPSTGLGMEMLPRSLQGPLDDFVSGKTDEAAFLEAVTWKKTWGFPFGLYKPLLLFCRAHHLRAFALNAPRDLAHAVAKGGLESLATDEQRQLPEMKPGPAAHRELVREAFGGHPHGRFADAKFERFYAAQLVWDETMADRVAAALKGRDAPHRLVVVAGEGHTRRFSVPDRAARRGVQPYVTVLPVLDDDVADAQNDKVADLYWVLETK